MNLPTELRTTRLWMRRWRAEDREPFAWLNADPQVMEYFPALLSREESDERVERIEAHFQQHGFGLWAVELTEMESFVGFIGLSILRTNLPCAPGVEIGWRLAAEHWGQGYATEGARAALDFGFGPLQLEQIVSFTVPANARSRRVMEKIGMKHSPSEDFDHPLLPEGHLQRRHVLYRAMRPPQNASRSLPTPRI